MKDKILPLDYDQYSVEELTEKANKIIESLETVSYTHLRAHET